MSDRGAARHHHTGGAARHHHTGGAARHHLLFDRLVTLFLAEGFAGFTVEDVATRLRCSKSTLYVLAPTKDQLARRVAIHFFTGAAERVEAAVAAADGARARVDAYLRAVARELQPASERFIADLSCSPAVAEVYSRNTAIAAERVRQLVAEGVEAGQFRAVPAEFVADVVAATMVRIQQRAVAGATGLDDAAAYAALADLVLHGLDPGEEPGPELLLHG